MNFSDEVYDYLKGEKFSSGLKLKVAKKEKEIPLRIDFLESLGRGQNVLHVGFADHIPLIKNKIDQNIWLHKRLVDASKKCIGIDIDREAVNYVKEEIGIREVYDLDITNKAQIPDEISQEHWDYIILGEVLEHVNNPVFFLQKIKENFVGNAKYVVVTVPNAWDLINIQLLKKNIEFINSDHRYWFTPYTLAKIGTESGLKCQSFQYVQNYENSEFWKKRLLRKFPAFRETVVMVFEIENQ